VCFFPVIELIFINFTHCQCSLSFLSVGVRRAGVAAVADALGQQPAATGVFRRRLIFFKRLQGPLHRT
jgi:hypothetical protein